MAFTTVYLTSLALNSFVPIDLASSEDSVSSPAPLTKPIPEHSDRRPPIAYEESAVSSTAFAVHFTFTAFTFTPKAPLCLKPRHASPRRLTFKSVAAEQRKPAPPLPNDILYKITEFLPTQFSCDLKIIKSPDIKHALFYLPSKNSRVGEKELTTAKRHLITIASKSKHILFDKESISEETIDKIAKREQKATRLEFIDCRFQNKAFAKIGTIQSLRALTLKHEPGCRTSVSDLATLPKGLTEFRFTWAKELDNTVPYIIANFKNLRLLDLTGCTTLRDTHIQEIADLTELQELILAHCFLITDVAMQAIGRCPKLEHVDLSHCSSIKNGLSSLTRSQNLHKLTLDHQNLVEPDDSDSDTDSDAVNTEPLAQIPSLDELSLGHATVNDKACEQVSLAQRITKIDLHYAIGLTDRGFSSLRAMPHLHTLIVTNALENLSQGSITKEKNNKASKVVL